MAQKPSSPHGLEGVKTVEEVQAMIQKSFRLPMVKFLRQRLAKAGCPVSDNFFKASECKGAHGTGGFVPGSGILTKNFGVVVQCFNNVCGKNDMYLSRTLQNLSRWPLHPELYEDPTQLLSKLFVVICKENKVLVCSNYMRIQDEVDQVVIHELINAFDDCRAVNIDWSDCAQQACSEIRAGHLSGDCHFKRELLRGYMKLRGHEPECIKRRVLKSVSSNPNCAGSAAADSMEAVWDICYNDTQPFDRAP